MTKDLAEPKVSQAPRKHSQEFKLGVVKRIEAGESLASVCNEFSLSRGLAHYWRNSYKEKGLEGLQANLKFGGY